MDLTKPDVSIPDGDPAGQALQVLDLEFGTGEQATAGRNVEVHYVGVSWNTGNEFDASWNRGQTFSFKLGGGQLWQALRQEGEAVPFILASGYAGRDTKEGEDIEPQFPILQKPWALGDLLERVRETLDA